MKYLDSVKLAAIMQSVFRDLNVNADALDHVVRSLIQTSLRAVDSHGVNLFPHYVQAVKSGRINKNPQFDFKQTSLTTGILFADHAFGHHAGTIAMTKAVEMAHKNGLGAVNVQNSTHFGAASFFALPAAKDGCIGFAFTNADALVKATGGQEAFCGTNPICFTAPLKNEEPFCLDMATSMVSWNKIRNHRRTNEPLLDGLAYDEQGNIVNDPHKAKSLAPAGFFKGFGLGIMIDILCAILGSGPISKDVLPMYTSPIEAKRNISHFFMAIDIEKFRPRIEFEMALQHMVDRLRMLRPTEASGGVMASGDPEKRASIERKQNGIPMDEPKFDEFISISSDFQDTLCQ